MPQLMPLTWVFSSMMLFTMVVVILLMYSASYFNFYKINDFNKSLSSFPLWW